MIARWRSRWRGRPRAERLALAVCGALAAALVYALLVVSLERALDRARAHVEVLRALAQRVDAQAAEIQRLRALGRPAASARELRLLVEDAARAAGLAGALRIDAKGEGEARVVAASTSFGAWLAFVERLQALHVRLSSARIEALAAPGLVSVTASFVRAGAP